MVGCFGWCFDGVCLCCMEYDFVCFDVYVDCCVEIVCVVCIVVDFVVVYKNLGI